MEWEDTGTSEDLIDRRSIPWTLAAYGNERDLSYTDTLLDRILKGVHGVYEGVAHSDPFADLEEDELPLGPVARLGTEPQEHRVEFESFRPVDKPISFTEDRQTTSRKERKILKGIQEGATEGSPASFRAAEELSLPSPRKNLTTQDFVMRMLAKEGMEYEWGGTTKKSGFDCSGIIWRIMTNAGHVNYPRHSSAIYEHSKKISLKKAINTRGAILYTPGHIAVSLGNGKTIEAMGEAYGVVVGDAHGRFTHGGLLPELKAGKRKKRPKAEVKQLLKQAQGPTGSGQQTDAGTLMKATSSAVLAPISFASVVGELQEPKPTTRKQYEAHKKAAGIAFVPSKYRKWVQTAAEQSGLSARLIGAVMQVESGFAEDVINFQRASSAGAKGPMQLMPFWSATYGDKVFKNPRANVLAGADILSNYIEQMGSVRLGLAAYNAGPSNHTAGLGYADKVLSILRGGR